MEFTDERIYEYGHSAFSSESDSDNIENHRSKKKKVRVQRPKSVEIKTENLPPKRNNNNNNNNRNNNSTYTNSNASTLIHINYDNNPPPVKKKSFFSRLFSKMSNLFWWKKKKEIIIPVTMTKEEKKKLKKKKKKRNCCLIIILITIILLLLGNIIALDVAYVAYRNSPLSNITTLINNPTIAQEQNLKSDICSTLFGSMEPLEFNCDFCWDNDSFYNVTSFCMLRSIYNNAFNQSTFDAFGWFKDKDFCRWFGIKCDDSIISEINLKFPLIPRVFDSRIGRVKTLKKLSIIGGIGGEPLPTNELPAGIFQLENLQTLEIISTAFFGKVPNTFDKMTSLKSIRITNNRKLFHPIPDSISLTSLNVLIYSMNNLTGTIPDLIGNSPTLQQSLEILDLSGNQFTGNIPDSLMSLTKLRSLVVAKNLLTGEFPISIITSKFAKTLQLINFAVNGFTGIIPPSIVECENLETLNLGGNSFTGSIPAELSRLTKLSGIILSSNKLTGDIPASIGEMKLFRLELSGNELTGVIPNNICQRRFSGCSLGKNNFTNIPVTCSTCTFL